MRKNIVGEEAYEKFKRWVDIGDLFGADGRLFRTKTGELTLQVDRYELLAKALRPLPEKFHGLRDIELRYRKRYQDLIVNPSVRATFRMRADIIRWVRDFFDRKGFHWSSVPTIFWVAYPVSFSQARFQWVTLWSLSITKVGMVVLLMICDKACSLETSRWRVWLP